MSTRTAGDLARLLGCPLEGDDSLEITGMAAPDRARPTDLIYVDGARHLARAAASPSRCVLVPPDLALPGKTLLRAPNPKLAFARAAEWLLPPSVSPGIHPTAVISPDARLGRDVAVGPYAVIEDGAEIGAQSEIGAFCFVATDARIGAQCHLYPRVTLYARAVLGDRVIVHSGAVIGSDGFGYVWGAGKHWKFPQIGEVRIADDVEIGANTTIDRGSLGTTEIASGVKLDNLVHVAHNVRIGDHTVIAAQTGISGSAVIGKNAALGGQAGLGERCRIEDGAIVGGQAGILPGKVVRSGHIVWGTPARPLEKFKEQFALLSILSDLARRLRKLEENAQPPEERGEERWG